jgi:recombination protein RecT
MNQAVQTVIPPRPQAEGYEKFGEVVRTKGIGDVLAHPEMMLRLRQAVPKHMSPDRMLRVLTQAIQKTPDLMKCTTASLLGAMMQLASLGLEPNTALQQAFLIPFKRNAKQSDGSWKEIWEVQVVLGYRGLIDLARRTGSLVSIHADVVYPGDEWTFEYGSHQQLRHVPTGDRTKAPVWAYAHARLTDGEAFVVMPYNEVLKIRNGAQGFQAALKAKEKYGANSAAYVKSPWVAYEHQMAAKSALRQLSKYLPMSIEFASAAALDEMSDAGNLNLQALAHITNVEDMVDMGAIEDQSGEQQPADFVEQGMQQQGGQQHQQVETAQQTQDAPQQQREAKPKGGKKAQAADPPKSPPPPAQQQAGQKDVDLTCMPFTAEIVDFDGKIDQFELPGDIEKFEAAFLAAMDVAARASQLKGFIDSHQQAITDMRADTPNLLARLEAKYGEHVAAAQQRQQQTAPIPEPEPDPDPRGDEPGDEDGPAQESFV